MLIADTEIEKVRVIKSINFETIGKTLWKQKQLNYNQQKNYLSKE